VRLGGNDRGSLGDDYGTRYDASGKPQ
jgi:hypothetical protein